MPGRAASAAEVRERFESLEERAAEVEGRDGAAELGLVVRVRARLTLTKSPQP